METWPSTSVISRVIREKPPADPSKFLGVRFLPLNTRSYLNTNTIQYDYYGPYRGMVHAHDLNTDPKLLKGETMGTKTMPTRYWKSASRVNESDILGVRMLGERYQQLQTDLLVKRAINRVKLAVDTRMEYLRWKALNNDLLTFNEDGIAFSEDYGLPSVTNSSVDWDELATADPVADVQNELLNFRGSGVTRVDMVVNGKVANWLSQNEGFFDRYSGTVRPGDFTAGKIAQTFLEMVGGGLLQGVWVYDGCYVDSNGTTQFFVPDNRCFLIGTSMETTPLDNDFGAEDMLGEFASTPAIRDGLDDVSPGMFAIAEDHTREGNPYFDAIGGIYGMPAIYHPTWIRRINTKQT